jgi:hypothetical protein
MFELPATIASAYRAASDEEVLSWSYGELRKPRQAAGAGWESARGSLDDEAIFGPRRDYWCACGKYTDRAALLSVREQVVCDRCGVKYTSRAARRARFGHIVLRVPVLHPAAEGTRLKVLPVVPGAFWESPAGSGLGGRYDALIGARDTEHESLVQGTFTEVLGLLLPVLAVAHGWDLADAETLARGMALASVSTG